MLSRYSECEAIGAGSSVSGFSGGKSDPGLLAGLALERLPRRGKQATRFPLGVLTLSIGGMEWNVGRADEIGLFYLSQLCREVQVVRIHSVGFCEAA